MDSCIWDCSKGIIILKIGFCSMSSQGSDNDKLYSSLFTTTLWVNLKTIDVLIAFRLTGSQKEWPCRLRVASSVVSNRFNVTCLIISKENFTWLTKCSASATFKPLLKPSPPNFAGRLAIFHQWSNNLCHSKYSRVFLKAALNPDRKHFNCLSGIVRLEWLT